VRESLAGRIEVVPLYPLSRAEVLGSEPPEFLAQAFSGEVTPPRERLIGDDLVAVVLTGGYPEVIARGSERRRRDWCRAYLEAIVERDVPDIAALEKAGQMPRLLEVLASQAGQLTNMSAVGGRLGLDHKTADRYLAVLEQLFLVRRLRPWFRNELKRLVRTPKLHFIDTGLLATLRGPSASRERLRADRQPFGALLESFVFGEITKQASWSDERPRLSHYRDKDGVEVDIVAESEDGTVVGVEIKAGATVTSADLQGLQRLAAATGQAFRLGVVLYDGDQVLPFGDRFRAAPLACLWS